MSTNLQYAYSQGLSYDVRRLLAQFVKPIYSNVFYQNRDALKNGADLVDFNKNVWLNYPLQFCQDHYKQQYLYPVILLVNNLGSIYDFLPNNVSNNKIIAPQLKTIVSVLSQARE